MGAHDYGSGWLKAIDEFARRCQPDHRASAPASDVDEAYGTDKCGKVSYIEQWP